MHPQSGAFSLKKETEVLRQRAAEGGDLDVHKRWLFIGANQLAVVDMGAYLVLRTA